MKVPRLVSAKKILGEGAGDLRVHFVVVITRDEVVHLLAARRTQDSRLGSPVPPGGPRDLQAVGHGGRHLWTHPTRLHF